MVDVQGANRRRHVARVDEGCEVHVSVHRPPGFSVDHQRIQIVEAIVLKAAKAGGTAQAWQEIQRYLVIEVHVACYEPAMKCQKPVRTGHSDKLESLGLILAE